MIERIDQFTISIISFLKLINYRSPEITFFLKYRGYGEKEAWKFKAFPCFQFLGQLVESFLVSNDS